MKFKRTLPQLLEKPTQLGDVFIDKTKWKKGSLPYFPYDGQDWPLMWKTTSFKEYPRMDKVVFPDPDTALLDTVSLRTVLQRRSSKRSFGETMTLEQLSTLLYFSVGMKDPKPPYRTNRFYPSPGSLYALEAYVISLNSDLPVGVYHYNVRGHYLEILETETPFVAKTYFNQEWVGDAGCLVFLTGVFRRNTVKYGQRGYRHVLVESGHVGQNLYLVSTALGLAGSGVGIWSDSLLEELLDIDGLAENLLYVFACGNSS